MIKSIVRKEIQVLLKQSGTFFWLLLMPLLFIVLFASIFNNSADSITIRYYDADATASSKQFVDTLGAIKGVKLATDADLTLDEQIAQIKDGKKTSLLVIPKGYEAALQKGGAQVDLYRDAAADTAVAPLTAMLQNVATGFREVKLKSTLQSLGQSDAQIGKTLSPPLNVNEIKESAVKTNAISQFVPGYTVMFVFFIIITMIRNFIRDKESGMLARLRSTPLKPHQYLIGMWIPNIIAVLVQCAVLLGFGNLVYDLSFGDPLAMAVIVVSLAICATGIGLMLSMLVRSENQGLAFTQILTMGGAALGGLWFPSDFMPKTIQIIGKCTPQYWAQHALQDIVIRGAGVADLWQPIAILLGIGIAGLLVAVARYKRFLLSAAS